MFFHAPFPQSSVDRTTRSGHDITQRLGEEEGTGDNEELLQIPGRAAGDLVVFLAWGGSELMHNILTVFERRPGPQVGRPTMRPECWPQRVRSWRLTAATGPNFHIGAASSGLKSARPGWQHKPWRPHGLRRPHDPHDRKPHGLWSRTPTTHWATPWTVAPKLPHVSGKRQAHERRRHSGFRQPCAPREQLVCEDNFGQR